MLIIPIDNICIKPRFRKNLGDTKEPNKSYTRKQLIAASNRSFLATGRVTPMNSITIIFLLQMGESLPEDHLSNMVERIRSRDSRSFQLTYDCVSCLDWLSREGVGDFDI